MMGWGVFWLTAYLVIATGQTQIIKHFNSSRGTFLQDIDNLVTATKDNNSYKLSETLTAFNHLSSNRQQLNNANTDDLSIYTNLVSGTVSEGLKKTVDDKTLSSSNKSHEPLNNEYPLSNEIVATTKHRSEESNKPDVSEAQPVSEDVDSVQHPESDEHPPKRTSHETESTKKLEKSEILSAAKISESKAISDNTDVRRFSERNNTEPSAEETVESCCGDDILVQTTHGPVKGKKWAENTNILGFIDIPYGQIKEIFGAPHQAHSWTDVHEVQDHDKRCPQYDEGDNYVGDLNCLTLSIFTPVDATNASVLFYVHDSSFQSGDPMIYGPEHLVPKGVILVLPNYRFGVLGFLCLQNETAPGNAGLKDLVQAMEWIRDNIQEFGGNPSNIVVGGDGDAGALVGYLAVCSQSKEYVNKVITESGSLLSHLALDRNPLETATILVNNIMINQTDETVYNNTFAEVSVKTIVEASKGIRFNPCVERDKEPFMQVTPWTLLHDKEIDTTFMIGFASYAGTHEAVAKSESFIEQLNEDLGLILPNDLYFNNGDERKEHALKVKTQYFGNDSITLSNIKELSLWSTDASYLGPLVRTARPLVQAGANVYLYEFAYVGNFNQKLISLNHPVEKAVRSDIIGYLFTQNGHLPEEGSDEKWMINLMVDLWVSFINTGIPVAENITWNELKATEMSEEEYLLISSDPQLVKGVHVKRLELWTELYNKYFIERNFAPLLAPGYYAFIVLIFWITNTKLDYNH